MWRTSVGWRVKMVKNLFSGYYITFPMLKFCSCFFFCWCSLCVESRHEFQNGNNSVEKSAQVNFDAATAVFVDPTDEWSGVLLSCSCCWMLYVVHFDAHSEFGIIYYKPPYGTLYMLRTFLLHSSRHKCCCNSATDLSASVVVDRAIAEKPLPSNNNTMHPHKIDLSAVDAIFLLLSSRFYLLLSNFLFASLVFTERINSNTLAGNPSLKPF